MIRRRSFKDAFPWRGRLVWFGFPALALAVLLLVWPAATPGSKAHGPVSGPIKILFEPVDLRQSKTMEGDETRSGPLRIGKLIYRGGLHLSTANHHLGGLSGLIISPDGRSLTAISDQAWWFLADLTYGPDGRLNGAVNGRWIKMLGPRGEPLMKRAWSDAEGLTAGPDGKLIVSFEQNHRIWVYDGADLNRPPQEIPLPDWLKSAPSNAGLEAITRRANGDLMIINEEFGKGGLTLGGLRRAGVWKPFQYRLGDWFKPTAAAELPNGDVLVLERRFSVATGFDARLMRLKAAKIGPGRILKSEPVAVFQKPLQVDNLEGLSLRRDAHGRTLVYLVSDNNFFPMQRTLLLMFELRD